MEPVNVTVRMKRRTRDDAAKLFSELGISTTQAINMFWMGIRCGELMALTPSDFLLEVSELRINKSYQRLRGEDVITKPKTRKSVRTIKMPAFLRDEMAEFIEMRDDAALDDDLQKQLALVMEIFNGLGEAPPPGRRAKREKGPGDDFFGMSRR